MAERVGEIRAQSQAKDVTLLKKHTTIEVLEIDDTDTITVPYMTTIESATVINLADASAVAATLATNVITIDDVAAVDSHVICLVVGV